MELLIDCYHGNPDYDLATLKAAGVVGIIHKVVEPLANPAADAKYAARKTVAQAGGMLWGGYLFMNNLPGVQQVDLFLPLAGVDGKTLLAIDLEAWATLTEAEAVIIDIFNQVGFYPVIYTRASYIVQIGGTKSAILALCPLWLADYSATSFPSPCLPWASVALWQRPSILIGGIDTDVDYWDGTLVELQSFWDAHSKPVAAKPESAAVLVKPGVPYSSQEGPGATRFRNDCGPACVKMLFDWKADALHLPRPGQTVDLVALASTLVTNNDAGMTVPAVIALAKVYGLMLNLNESLSIGTLKGEIDAGRPVFCFINYEEIVERQNQADAGGHFVLAVGYTDQHIIYHDPDYYAGRSGENLSASIAEFARAISAGVGALVAPAQLITGVPPVTSATPPYDVITTATVLNVRGGPGTSYPVLTTLLQDARVTVIDDSGGWHQISIGWISAAYTKPANPPVPPPPVPEPTHTIISRRVTADVLNIRPDPSTNKPPIGQLNAGDTVDVFSPAVQGGSLMWFALAKRAGYVAAMYTGDPLPSQPPIVPPIPPVGPVSPHSKLSLHISVRSPNGEILDLFKAASVAGRPIRGCLLLQENQGGQLMPADILAVSPGTLYIVERFYWEHGSPDWNADEVTARAAGKQYWLDYYNTFLASNPAAHKLAYQQIMNEPTGYGRATGPFWSEASNTAHSMGFKITWLNFPYGFPPLPTEAQGKAFWESIWPYAEQIKAQGMVLLHQYVKPDPGVAADWTNNWFIMRHQQIWKAAPLAWQTVLLCFGEFGTGYGRDIPGDYFKADITAADTAMQHDDYVIFAALWGTGDPGGWAVSDLTNKLPIIGTRILTA